MILNTLIYCIKHYLTNLQWVDKAHFVIVRMRASKSFGYPTSLYSVYKVKGTMGPNVMMLKYDRLANLSLINILSTLNHKIYKIT